MDFVRFSNGEYYWRILWGTYLLGGKFESLNKVGLKNMGNSVNIEDFVK